MVSGQKSKDLNGEKISVLLVDDSRIFRSFIEDYFRNDAFFEIIGSTWNGNKALEFLEKRIPDIIVLDVEMPELTGLETLGKINQIKAFKGIAPNDIGVIMLSGQSSECTDNSMQALELGAFDVISKPPVYEDRFQIKAFLKDLNEKLLAFAARKRPEILPEKVRLATVNRSFEKSNIRNQMTRPAYKAVLIGASTGGPKALTTIIPPLLKAIDLPVIVAMHMPKNFTASMTQILRKLCGDNYIFNEAHGGEKVAPQTFHLAEGGRHLMLRKGSMGLAITEISDEPTEDGFCPSINRLFSSAAEVWGGRVIAVILTGMGTDGTRGQVF